MFKCGNCGKRSEPGQKRTLRPVELREKQYVGRETYHRADGSVVRSDRLSVQGRGFEIVREEARCEACLKIPIVPKVHHLPSDSAT